MEYSFGLRGHDLADNFEDMCAVAKKNNINELQFAMAKTIKDIDFYEFGYNPSFSLKIKNKLSEFDLKVDVLGCYINPVNPDREALDRALRLFENFICYAKDFKASVIGTETGVNGDINNTWSEENYRYFLENISPLVRKAEDNGVIIGIEPVRHFTISSPNKAKRMLDDLKSRNVSIILDVANLIAMENRGQQYLIIDQAFELLADKIKVIHLKDFTFENGQNKYAMLGDGELDIKYLFSKIKEYNVPCQFILDATNVVNYTVSVKRIEEILSEGI